MAGVTSPIPELEQFVRQVEPGRRSEIVRQIAQLFLQGASGFQPDHVDLFDTILVDLIPFTDSAARMDLAERLSLLSNAPSVVVNQLAQETEILIAGPLLRRSLVVDEQVLSDVARQNGQSHLLAISERPQLSAGVTDLIIRRGDREVVRRVASNSNALFSQTGYATLVKKAARDGVLTLTLGQREDLPEAQLRTLLAGSIDAVRHRLHQMVKPERQVMIRQMLNEIGGISKRGESRRDFAAAQRAVLALYRAGDLNEAALLGFAKAYRYDESVAMLSAISGVKVSTLDHLVSGDRYDPVIILGKALGLQWATVRVLILLRFGPSRVPAPADMEIARQNFMRLIPATAERVVKFWQSGSPAPTMRAD